MQPAWPGPADQGMTAVGRLAAQGAGPQEAKVATGKPPRPTEAWVTEIPDLTLELIISRIV